MAIPIATAILEQLKAHLVRVEAAAATMLDKAIARDPEYAPAYALRGIAALLLAENSYGTLPLPESWAQGKLYVDKALQLDSQLAEAWAGLGLYHSSRHGEHPQAIEALEKALSINPNLIDASNWLQIAYSTTGESRRAFEILEGMVERDPLYPPAITSSTIAYCDYGQFDEAKALLDRIRPFMPGDPQVMQAEAVLWIRQGQPSRALPLLEVGHAAQPDDAVMKICWTLALSFLDERERIVNEGGAPGCARSPWTCWGAPKRPACWPPSWRRTGTLNRWWGTSIKAGSTASSWSGSKRTGPTWTSSSAAIPAANSVTRSC